MVMALCIVACRRAPYPKEYGYYRITLPEHAYTAADLSGYPYQFEISKDAEFRPVKYENEQYWINVHHPTLNADICCSYKPVRGNLGQLLDDTQTFVYNHAMKATAIPEHEYAHPEANAYGLLIELEGNTATPVQFFLTDSTHHFFRGAIYVNCVPNQDSLAPVTAFLKEDVKHLMETLHWTR